MNYESNNKELESKLLDFFRDYKFNNIQQLADLSDVNISQYSRLLNHGQKLGVISTVKLLKCLSKNSEESIDKIWLKFSKLLENFDIKYNEKKIGSIEESIKNFLPSNLEKIQQVIHNLPKSSEIFIGRKKEQEKLLYKYLKKRGKIIVIDGSGGVGKTALALKVAHLLIEENNVNFPIYESIIFASAKNNRLINGKNAYRITINDSLEKILNVIANTLNSEQIKQSDNLEEKCEYAYEILREHRTLLIIDNLETIQGELDLLAFIDDLPDSVTTLITTREKRYFYSQVILNSLGQEEALQLIEKLVNQNENISSLNVEEQNELYEATSGIPLGIEYAIGLLNVGNHLQDVINILKSGQNNLVSFLFETSVGKLRNSATEEEIIAHKILMAMSLLEEPLHSNVIREIAGVNNNLDFDINQSFTRLIQLCLIRELNLNKEFESDLGQQYTMLSLTREYVHKELMRHENFKNKAIERWIQYYVNLAQEYGKDYGETQRGDWFTRFNILENQLLNLLSVSNFCATYGYYEKFKELWQSLHLFTEVYGHWGDHEQYLGILAEQAERKLDPATTVFAKSAMARVKIRACSVEESEIARKLLQEARQQSQRISLSLSVQVELLENHIMLYIELEKLKKAQDYLNELNSLVNQVASNHKDLTNENSIRYKLIVKYRQGQIFHKKASLEQDININGT